MDKNPQHHVVKRRHHHELIIASLHTKSLLIDVSLGYTNLMVTALQVYRREDFSSVLELCIYLMHGIGNLLFTVILFMAR